MVYYTTESFLGNRDQYDANMKQNQNEFQERHETQLNDATNVESIDREWAADKNAVNKLDVGISQRRQNYITYQGAITAEKKLYNNERRRTVILVAANLIALGGCAFVWFG